MHIKVKTHPNSKKERIVIKSEDSFDVHVKEKPERGLATKAVLKALAHHFKITRGVIKLIKGARSRNKIFEIKI
ncbi:MAG: DUF167 family protein [Patescibacteria group bacterium]